MKDFGTNTTGSAASASLMQASDCKPYGMTLLGGSNGYGVIFSFDPSSSTYTKVKDFDTTNGGIPVGSLTQASDGKLYGTTYGGGSSDQGVIFSFDPSSSTYTKLQDYNGINGAWPFIGSAFIKIGAVSKITTPNTSSTPAVTNSSRQAVTIQQPIAKLPVANTLKAFPNPSANSHYRILLPNKIEGEVSYMLLSLTGTRLSGGTLLIKKPTSSLDFNFSGQMVSQGEYYLLLEGQKLKAQVKLMHLK